MKNFESLLAAYLGAWAVFFVYLVTLAQRMARLREEIQRLKEKIGSAG